MITTIAMILAMRLQAAEKPKAPEAAWSWTVKKSSADDAKGREAFDAFVKARLKDLPEGKEERARQDGVVAAREPVATGSLPEVLLDEPAWEKAIAFLESEAGVPAERIAELRKAKPDFTREMVLAFVFKGLTDPGGSLTSRVDGIRDEADGLKVRVHTRSAFGGTPKRSEPQVHSREVLFFKVPRTLKKVVIEEGYSAPLYP